MNKLEKIKFYFKYINEEPDIYNFGKYIMGLSNKEIEMYFQARANKLNVNKLIKKFHDVAGCNTATAVLCDCCGEYVSLMYRYDVKRFADIVFGKTNSTYFD